MEKLCIGVLVGMIGGMALVTFSKPIKNAMEQGYEKVKKKFTKMKNKAKK